MVHEKIVLTCADLLLNQNIAKDFKYLLDSQYLPLDELENYQNQKLRELVNHSYKNVQFYRELFDSLNLRPADIQTRKDLYKLPVLTKNDIRLNFSNRKIIANNISKKEIILNSSSGSTGEPLKYFSTKESYSFKYAGALRGWYWTGYRLGDKYVKLSQNPRSKVIKKAQDLFNRSLYLYSQQLTKQNFKIIIEKINKFKPKVIRGYPDVILFLANYIKNNKIEVHSPKVVTTTGNILFDNTRQIIEEVFGCKIFDSYSCEGLGTIAECLTHNCYHTSMEYSIIEIISNNKEVAKGEKGRLITTDLHNYALPFIRYDTQDYVTKSKNNCSCGRNLLAIEKIDGRDSDILITPKRKYLIFHNFSSYFRNINSVEQFQVRQNALDDFNIILKVNSKYSNEIERNIYEYFEKYINESVKIKISVVDDIPLTKSGKRRMLIRNQEIKLDF